MKKSSLKLFTIDSVGGEHISTFCGYEMPNGFGENVMVSEIDECLSPKEIKDVILHEEIDATSEELWICVQKYCAEYEITKALEKCFDDEDFTIITIGEQLTTIQFGVQYGSSLMLVVEITKDFHVVSVTNINGEFFHCEWEAKIWLSFLQELKAIKNFYTEKLHLYE